MFFIEKKKEINYQKFYVSNMIKPYIHNGEPYVLDEEKAIELNCLYKVGRPTSWTDYVNNYETYTSYFPKEKREALQVYEHLQRLRFEWLRHLDSNTPNYFSIIRENNECKISYDVSGLNHTLSFPTKNMADDFLTTFNDMIILAKEHIA